MLTVTKQYRDLPAAHRQPNHEGHCRLIHGHNWGFDITFFASTLDACGFVVDVGKLGWVRDFLIESFDHTLLLNANDPQLRELTIELEHYADIVVVPNCGMEGLAKWVCDSLNELIHQRADEPMRGLQVIRVTCWEDAKNSATYDLRNV